MHEGGFSKDFPVTLGLTEEHKWELLDKFQDGLIAAKQFLLVQVLESWNTK